jgi:Zn-dependent M28 family amino/carboxypeptidase
LPGEVIIIGGHFDAVGRAGKVVNGALDNASGVVDIMGAAQAMAQSGIQLKRSVMFLFIGGKRTGWLVVNFMQAILYSPLKKQLHI